MDPFYTLLATAHTYIRLIFLTISKKKKKKLFFQLYLIWSISSTASPATHYIDSPAKIVYKKKRVGASTSSPQPTMPVGRATRGY